MNTKIKPLVCSLGVFLSLASYCLAAGPYAATNWPPTIDPNKIVHYCVVDGAFGAPNPNWTNTLSVCAVNQGADQGTQLNSCVLGYSGLKAMYTFMGFADTNFTTWSNVPAVDVLMQVYGDTSVLNPTNYGMTRRIRLEEGNVGSTGYVSYNTPTPGVNKEFTTNAYNNRWNWILFTFTNALWTNATDNQVYRQIGNIKPGAISGSEFGGINHGTVRLRCGDNNAGMVNWMVHAVAIGEAGAFGTTNDVDTFEPPRDPGCPPVPAANLVGIDFNVGITNNLVVVSNSDAYVELVQNIGPTGDQRTAVQPIYNGGGAGSYLYNFGILDNYLGLPCNNNAVFKVCVDFYDDPAYADAFPVVQFGPEAYATDGLGCSAPTVYPSSSLHTLTGTGQWIRRSWIVPNVNLLGVNTAPLTGGPRLVSKFAQVKVSRVEMGILRSGTDPLAGQDPLAGCPADPNVCLGLYTNYVELDLANGVTSGLDVGTAGTDQAMVVEAAGPANDQRNSVRGDIAPNYYVQFQITGNALGQTYQDNAQLAIVVTYYDDPALAGKKFGIDAWRYHYLGTDNIFAADSTKWITLEGKDKWRDAYWEIDQISFAGVNQAPQAAARFKCEDKIHICRVRYAVIRTCGPDAGVNLLDSYRVTSLAMSPDTNGLLRLSWPYQEPQLTVQGCTTLGAPWSTFMGTPILPESENAVVRLSPTNSSALFRLYRPSIP